jgi:hypothetical protein
MPPRRVGAALGDVRGLRVPIYLVVKANHYGWRRVAVIGLPIVLIAASCLALGLEGIGYPGLLPGHTLSRKGACYDFHEPVLMGQLVPGCTEEVYKDGTIFRRYADGHVVRIWPR